MRRKYIVTHEAGFDPELNRPKYEEVKVFKNEPEVMAFIHNPKNQRRYGTMFVERHDGNGMVYDYDERINDWRAK